MNIGGDYPCSICGQYGCVASAHADPCDALTAEAQRLGMYEKPAQAPVSEADIAIARKILATLNQARGVECDVSTVIAYDIATARAEGKAEGFREGYNRAVDVCRVVAEVISPGSAVWCRLLIELNDHHPDTIRKLADAPGKEP